MSVHANTREAWEKAGRKDIVQRAKDIVSKKLRDHYVEPLDASIARGLDEIVRDSEGRVA